MVRVTDDAVVDGVCAGAVAAGQHRRVRAAVERVLHRAADGAAAVDERLCPLAVDERLGRRSGDVTLGDVGLQDGELLRGRAAVLLARGYGGDGHRGCRGVGCQGGVDVVRVADGVVDTLHERRRAGACRIADRHFLCPRARHCCCEQHEQTKYLLFHIFVVFIVYSFLWSLHSKLSFVLLVAFGSKL